MTTVIFVKWKNIKQSLEFLILLKTYRAEMSTVLYCVIVALLL